MKLADLPRSQNRALINELFDGFPPYSEQEAQQNRMVTNINDLAAPKIAHDARRQYTHAFFGPGNYFNVRVDRGPVWKRQGWSDEITQNINRIKKASAAYTECLKGVFAQNVLHGVGPSVWPGKEKWCPEMQSMGDVMIPSKTLRSMSNLEHFAIYRRFTGAELHRMTSGPNRDPGWNKDMVDRCLAWVHKQTNQQNGAFDNTYSPERVVEDYKGDAGLYASDQSPTVNVWDFFFYDDSKGSEGWKRRIILDCPSSVDQLESVKGAKTFLDTRGEFLYNSGERNYAEKLDQIIHFQFADASAVAPFRYHTVRSLGWLLYAVCHVQNRLRCRFLDSTFESLLNYFRSVNPGDEGKVAQIDLINMGIIPNGLEFVKAQERWNINPTLVEAAMAMNRQSMADNSASFVQNFDYAKEKTEQTATEVMAQVHATSALVGSMLEDAYNLQEAQYREIARRFCIKNSSDPDVKKFQLLCLKAGVPRQVLDSDCWDISAERTIGSGNRQLEIGQSQLLMSQFNRFDPDAQRLILRKFAYAASSDPALAEVLVPMKKSEATETQHDAALATGTLMQGVPVPMKEGYNHIEYVETMLKNMGMIIKGIEAQGGMTTPEKVVGLQTMAQNIQMHIAKIAEDAEEKARVKKYGDILGKFMNLVKAYAQRLAERQQANGENGVDPETKGKIQSMVILAKTKAAIKAKEAEQKMKLNQQKHQLGMANEVRRTQVGEAAMDLKTAGEINRSRLRSTTERE